MPLTPLQTQMAADAQAVTADGGEAITYTPKGGAPATFNAIIGRAGLIPRSTDMSHTLFWSITVQADVADIPPENININGDQISLPRRVGEEPRAYTISAIIKHDYATVILSVTEA